MPACQCVSQHRSTVYVSLYININGYALLSTPPVTFMEATLTLHIFLICAYFWFILRFISVL